MPTGTSLDLTGRTFGFLTVIRKAKSKVHVYPHAKSTTTYWDCVCSANGRLCKHRVRMSATSLANMKSKSCGCMKSFKGSSPTTFLHGNYKRKAAQRGLSFRLSVKQVARLVSLNCHYCGRAPHMNLAALLPAHAGFRYNSIDRKDSSKGYTSCNTVPCCKTCQKMKWDWPYEVFLAHIEAIHAHQAKQPCPTS